MKPWPFRFSTMRKFKMRTWERFRRCRKVSTIATRDALSRDLLGKLLIRRNGRRCWSAASWKSRRIWTAIPAAHSFAGRTHAMRYCGGHREFVCVLHLRESLLLQCVLPAGRQSGRRAVPRGGTAGGIKRWCTGATLIGRRERPSKLTSGPGRLAEAFGITRARDNGKT